MLDAKTWVEFCENLFPGYRNMTKEEVDVHREFLYNFFEEQKDSNPEIQEVINNHFWELFED